MEKNEYGEYEFTEEEKEQYEELEKTLKQPKKEDE